ncbi:MAG: phosphoribosyltransferase [Pseudomonadota bacterium]
MSPTSAPPYLFQDRHQAGRALAEALQPRVHGQPVVLALPRGGVPVGYEVAKAFDAPLDLVLVRKIGAPGHPEFGIGAVVDGTPPRWVVDESLLEHFSIPVKWFEAAKKAQLREIERRRGLYCGNRPPEAITGREVIVVDDGVATGSTARVALLMLRETQPQRLILAVPVGPREAIEALRPLVDELVCLFTPAPFHAVGLHYADFTQTTDTEVIELLARAEDHGRPG